MDNHTLFQFPPDFNFEDATGLTFDENSNPYASSGVPITADTVGVASFLPHTEAATSFDVGEAPEHILPHARESSIPCAIPAATSTNRTLSPARQSPIHHAVPTAAPTNQESEELTVVGNNSSNTTHPARDMDHEPAVREQEKGPQDGFGDQSDSKPEDEVHYGSVRVRTKVPKSELPRKKATYEVNKKNKAGADADASQMKARWNQEVAIFNEKHGYVPDYNHPNLGLSETVKTLRGPCASNGLNSRAAAYFNAGEYL